MKFLLLIYSNPENWEHPMFLRDPEFLAMPEAERAALVEQADALRKELDESGELLSAVPLADPVTTRTVRVRDRVLTTTDGPYLETKEYMASFYLLDCESEERALEIAADMPWADQDPVEFWPILHEAAADV
jgi:hypothetical protein